MIAPESSDTLGAGVADALDDELSAALRLLRDGVERLLEISDRGDLCALGPARLIAFAQRFEAHRAQLAAVDTGIVEAAREEHLESYTCSRTLPLALAEALRISHGTAKARVARAEQMMPENAFSAGTASAQLPVLADAVRAGAVTVDQMNVIGAAMTSLRTNPEIGVEAMEQAEHVLVADAVALTPEALRVVAAKIDDVLLPDGVLPREAVAVARRGLTIGPERRDGTHAISGSLTRVAHARLMSVLSPLAAPRPTDDELGTDARTAAQRMHDALDDLACRVLDTAGLPRGGGTPATVHVTIDVDQLRAAVGNSGRGDQTTAGAATTFGDRLTLGELVQVAEQARIIPTYLSSTAGVIAYGTQRRCATEAQTQALISRDKGCSFPGCDAPAEWCERHHVIPWCRGGPTDLDNLTLVCGYHHREFEKRGWRVRMVHGSPVWIPPAWIDRAQRPRVNARIRSTLDVAVLDKIDDLGYLADSHLEPVA